MDVPLQAGSLLIDIYTPQEGREGFERAEVSLALDGLHPSGPVHGRARAAVIAGRMASDQAAAEISGPFGSDVEQEPRGRSRLERPGSSAFRHTGT